MSTQEHIEEDKTQIKGDLSYIHSIYLLKYHKKYIM